MDSTTTTFDSIVEQCRIALQNNYRNGMKFQAEQLFEAEVELLRDREFQELLIQVVNFGQQLRQRNVPFHLIGSGGSSLILFLSGISHVDPVHFDLHFQRLWTTANGQPPIVQFAARLRSDIEESQLILAEHASVHPLTELEVIPSMFDDQVATVSVTEADHSTMLSLRSGETDGIFQLESDTARRLLRRIQPTGIMGLAYVTALEQISHASPDVMDEYLARFQPGLNDQEEPSFLFQESIMSLLHLDAGLTLEDAYRFVQAAAKRRMTSQHNLWDATLQGLQTCHGTTGKVIFEELIESCRWAVCKAHHVANAITSYRAAWLKTHHRVEFERARSQYLSVEQGV